MELESTTSEVAATESSPVAPDVGSTDNSKPETETGLSSLKSAPKTEAAVAPAESAYSPNFKFKVMDSEHEIEDWIKPVVKNKEIEDKIKDLYLKAYGLDAVKPKYQTLKDDFDQLKQKAQQTDIALETLGRFVKENDFDSFFDGLNIPKNKVLEYALELVKREQWTPEQKAQWEASKQAREAVRYYELQNQQLQQSQQHLAVQQRTFELDMALNQPEAKVVSDVYNTGMSSPDAFRNYCIQIGQAYAARGEDISAQQAVAEAVRQIKAMNPVIGSGASPNAAQVVQPSSKPVIPNIQGRGTSAVKSTVKSLDDLKKRAKELSEQY